MAFGSAEKRTRLFLCVPAISCLSLLGCTGDAPGGRGVEVTDSAGILLVQNPLPHTEDGPSWMLGVEPEAEIGLMEGAAEYQLFDVSDAVVFSDGGLVVANRGTHELRFYDGRGKHQRTVGGEGDGPGEFRWLEFIDRFEGDSLLAFDGRQRRVSVFDRHGRYIRSFSLNAPTNSGQPSLAGVLSNGAIVIRETLPYIAGVAPTGPDRSPVRLLLSDPTGTGRDTLGVFPGAENFVFVVPSDFWFSVRPVTFGRRLVSAVKGDRVAVAETDTFAIHIYSSEGRLHQIVRQHRVPVPIEATDIVHFNDSVLSAVEDPRSRQHYREMFELMPTHEAFPALASIRLDGLGHLWVEEYPSPGDRRSRWQVFDEDGRLVARLETPPGLRVLDIGTDYLVGVTRDDLGVERVLLYALDKAPT